MNYKEKNPNAIAKLVKLTEWDIPHTNIRTGIIINDVIMIAKNHSRWKKLGSLDWYPYYGLKNLIEALYDDALDEYAEEQQSKTHRKFNSVPINHDWKNKQKKVVYKAKYEHKLEPLGLFKHEN